MASQETDQHSPLKIPTDILVEAYGYVNNEPHIDSLECFVFQGLL